MAHKAAKSAKAGKAARPKATAKATSAALVFEDVHLNVTPLEVVGGEAWCMIEPAPDTDPSYVEDGAIRLPRGQPVTLHFHLQNGADNAFKRLEFDDEPWSYHPTRCPDDDDNDNVKFPHARREGGKLAIVEAPPTPPGRGHYSLNFELGIRWDPIIIRD